MKILLLGFLIIMTGNAWAKTWNCDVKNQANLSSGKKEHLSIQTNGRLVSSIEYIQEVPNDSGAREEKSEALYGEANRGGFVITECNPDRNEYSENIGLIRMFSQCHFGSGKENIVFRAQLSDSSDGKVSTIVFSSEREPIVRTIIVKSCR